jgi:hypothetical protein
MMVYFIGISTFILKYMQKYERPVWARWKLDVVAIAHPMK